AVPLAMESGADVTVTAEDFEQERQADGGQLFLEGGGRIDELETAAITQGRAECFLLSGGHRRNFDDEPARLRCMRFSGRRRPGYKREQGGQDQQCLRLHMSSDRAVAEQFAESGRRRKRVERS